MAAASLWIVFRLRNSFQPKSYAGFIKFRSSPFKLNDNLLVLFHFYSHLLLISVFFFLSEGQGKPFNIKFDETNEKSGNYCKWHTD